MTTEAYMAVHYNAVLARAEAAEKREAALREALNVALEGWKRAPPMDQDDYYEMDKLRAVLEAKP
jgi:hypothetical protein